MQIRQKQTFSRDPFLYQKIKSNIIFIGVSLFILVSCASVPKASVDMSIQLEQQLYALKRANAEIIENIYKEKENNVIDFLDDIWYPQFLENWFETPAVIAVWDEAVKTNSIQNRMKILTALTKVGMNKYQSQKAILIKPILEEKEATLKSFNDEYDMAIKMNTILMKNLISNNELQKQYNDYLGKVISPQKLDSIVQQSLKKIDNRLNQIQSELDKAEAVEEKVKDIINIIKE